MHTTTWKTEPCVLRFALSALVVFGLAGTSVWAQQADAAPQVTGTLGSPSATTTIDGKQLPAPDPAFGGVIKQGALESKAWWAPRIVPPKKAPNILLIMTDDSGFGVPSTFGGVIPTPTMDRIATTGLRFNNIHSTALCSPTRAALITGRNHHSAGFGVISEQSTGFPGYNRTIGKDKANYKPPFPLTARLDKLTLEVDRPQLSPTDIEKLKAAQRNNKSSE